MNTYDEYSIERCDALEYLYNEWASFPNEVPGGGIAKDISIRFFRGWQFMRKNNGPVIFLRCHPITGVTSVITKEDFDEYKKVMQEQGL